MWRMHLISLKGRWRCLGTGKLYEAIELVSQRIIGCCFLHNICIDMNDNDTSDNDDNDDSDHDDDSVTMLDRQFVRLSDNTSFN